MSSPPSAALPVFLTRWRATFPSKQISTHPQRASAWQTDPIFLVRTELELFVIEVLWRHPPGGWCSLGAKLPPGTGLWPRDEPRMIWGLWLPNLGSGVHRDYWGCDYDGRFGARAQSLPFSSLGRFSRIFIPDVQMAMVEKSFFGLKNWRHRMFLWSVGCLHPSRPLAQPFSDSSETLESTSPHLAVNTAQVQGEPGMEQRARPCLHAAFWTTCWHCQLPSLDCRRRPGFPVPAEAPVSLPSWVSCVSPGGYKSPEDRSCAPLIGGSPTARGPRRRTQQALAGVGHWRESIFTVTIN